MLRILEKILVGSETNLKVPVFGSEENHSESTTGLTFPL
jgi:hypothetical protein